MPLIKICPYLLKLSSQQKPLLINLPIKACSSGSFLFWRMILTFIWINTKRLMIQTRVDFEAGAEQVSWSTAACFKETCAYVVSECKQLQEVSIIFVKVHHHLLKIWIHNCIYENKSLFLFFLKDFQLCLSQYCRLLWKTTEVNCSNEKWVDKSPCVYTECYTACFSQKSKSNYCMRGTSET